MMQSGPPIPQQINLSHSILSGGTFIQNNQNNYNRSGERPGYARLLENVATAALHDSLDNVDPPKCHPNTRVAIMQCIIDWAVGMDPELSGKPILWLKGAAGAGKSAIARSVAERCSDERLLLGTFFFGAADSTRNHVGKLVATLSYQISVILPGFRDMVAAFIEDDPLIFGRSIKTQFSTLIIRPLSTVLANHSTILSTTPRLIIIDGLDECSAVNSQRDLLLTLQEVTNTTTLIRFLVCSRPESHLNSAFSLSRMAPILHYIFLDDDDYSASKDISVYLEDMFKQIKEGHVFKHTLQDPWPTPEMLETLVNKSSGQFIYAATVVRYVESHRHRPDQRLNAIFNLRPPFKDLPFMELDALYRLIISKAEDLPTVLDILAFSTLYEGFDVRDIEAILQLEQGSAEVMLADLHSIITISLGMVKFLHKSLADFLSEPQRSGDLYRDLSREQLSHVARIISIFSKAHCGQQTGHIYRLWSISSIFLRVLGDLWKNPDSMKADYVSSDILQAAQQFPIFEFIKPFLSYGRTKDWMLSGWEFIGLYIYYLYCIKDVCESTRLVYWEQIRGYCECVWAVLDDNWSSDWKAHFIYAYHHLLHDPCYRLPPKISYVHLHEDFSNIHVGTFGETILHVTGMNNRLGYYEDMVKISCDLIGSIKEEEIFAKSASFCLALLCDERYANLEDAGRIYGTDGHDRRKKREHPWHWHQMVSRAPSLGNRLALIACRKYWHPVYELRLTRIRKALQTIIPYHYNDIRVITMREYIKFYVNYYKSIPKTRRSAINDDGPQQWPLYIFLLDLLPHILPLSGRYEPLVTMCRKKCLSSLSQFWPKKSRRARRAIDSYLRRMDSQEGMET
ncbi:hypothetical protein D9613_012816 [Agrocybe pediades]|uniref:Nephrocystin 3-like N-terminal domain-containing protein n=1 Tax=Agrocybe pediades TaxID=84607 RepID=A0A8H4VTL0_9AGAR|nr:hypothetical protein D9613_012816 [Agrocybe pediades]